MTDSLTLASLSELHTLFTTLHAPEAEQRHGFFRAKFIGPWWLRLSGKPSVAISGLPGWQGKRFLDSDTVTNVLKKSNGTQRDILSMTCVAGLSQIDGKLGVALHYGADAPKPWRWVRDELRMVNTNTFLGMTIIDLPVLRRIAFPFLLVREA